MSTSPYEVLGVSPSASDDQIKAAYRRMAKKYHPDVNNGSAAAETKMKQINEAYTVLTKQKGKTQPGGGAYRHSGYGQAQGNQSGYGGAYQSYAGQSQSAYGGGNPFGSGDPFGFGDFFQGSQQRQWQRETETYTEMDPQLKRVEDAYRDQNYARAQQLLSGIHNRRAAWYYWSAKVDLALGNRVSAINNARQASQMEPDQEAFRELYANLRAGGQRYRDFGSRQGFGGAVCSNPCLTCMVINVFCNCCMRSGVCC